MTDKALNVTSDADRNMLRSAYEHRDADEMIRSLELILEMYARPGSWIEEPHGEPPHFLRRGKRLGFDPSNVVDGYRFAEEALSALARFRERQKPSAEEAVELAWGLIAEAPKEALAAVVEVKDPW